MWEVYTKHVYSLSDTDRIEVQLLQNIYRQKVKNIPATGISVLLFLAWMGDAVRLEAVPFSIWLICRTFSLLCCEAFDRLLARGIKVAKTKLDSYIGAFLTTNTIGLEQKRQN